MSIEKLSTNASLKDVMDKFEEISLQDFVDLDVIIKEELPNDVKENQIVLISNDPNCNIIIADSDPGGYLDKLNENDILVSFANYTTNLNLFKKNISAKIPLGTTYKKYSGAMRNIKGYLGVDNEWVQFSFAMLVLLKGANEPNSSLYGNLAVTYSSYPTITVQEDCIYIANGTGSTVGGKYPQAWGYNNILPFSKYSKLKVNFNSMSLDLDTSGTYKGGYLTIGVNTKATGTGDWLASYKLENPHYSDLSIELDISNIDQDGYFCIYAYVIRNGYWFDATINEIKMY